MAEFFLGVGLILLAIFLFPVVAYLFVIWCECLERLLGGWLK